MIMIYKRILLDIVMIIALMLTTLSLASCNNVNGTVTEYTSEPTTIKSTETIVETTASTTTVATTVPTNPLAWIDNNDLSGSYNLIGTDRRYAYPYGDNILINIQSDLQSGGLHLLDKDGNHISLLNGQTTLQNLLVVDNILFGLDYLDFKTDTTGINYRLIILDLEKPENTFKLDIYTSDYAFADGRLYFINAEDNFRLYSSKPDGSDQKPLTDFPVSNISAIANQIILVDDNDYHRIKIIDLDGNLISSAAFAQIDSYALIEDDIFILANTTFIGHSSDRIAEQGNYLVRIPLYGDMFAFADSLCEKDGFYYFIGGESDGEQYIWKMTSTGSNGKTFEKLTDVKGVFDLQLIEDDLFFRSNEHSSMHCMIKTDGTGFKELLP